MVLQLSGLGAGARGWKLGKGRWGSFDSSERWTPPIGSHQDAAYMDEKGLAGEMTDVGWTDITILERTTVRDVGDRVEVQWKLSVQPEREWAEILRMADLSERQGSVEWVLGGGPRVTGDVVRWIVPAKDIENADADVRHRMYMANGRFGAERSALVGEGIDERVGEPTEPIDPSD
jgi:hypothetical protein